MQDWADGYVTEIEYPSSFYEELAPIHMNYAVLSRAMAAPGAVRPYTWLEIGCGGGESANVLAAANPDSRFYAFDFNPVHIERAQSRMREAALENVTFFDDSFEEALDRDLPPMDYIVAHGIYSWVSPENRRHVIALIRKLLKPGGIFYVSYNCLPGWSSKAPLQRLIADYAARQDGGVLDRIRAACDFIADLKQRGARYFADNPPASELAASMAGRNTSYLAHEYLNAHWQPCYHSDVAADMAAAQLTFAASSTLIDNADQAVLTPAAAALLQEEPDPVMREMLRDFAVNQNFRRDLYVRGAARRSPSDFIARAARQRLCLFAPRKNFSLKATLPAGPVHLPADVYEPVLDALAAGPKSLDQLAKAAGLSLHACVDVATILCSLEHAHLMVDEPAPAATASCRAYNDAALRRAVTWEGPQTLAASNLGTGVDIRQTHQFFLHAHIERIAEPVGFIWERMQASNKRLHENGKRIEDDAENLQRLRGFEDEFSREWLPLYRTWGIVS